MPPPMHCLRVQGRAQAGPTALTSAHDSLCSGPSALDGCGVGVSRGCGARDPWRFVVPFWAIQGPMGVLMMTTL